MSKDTGGPAFPMVRDQSFEERLVIEQGMTLRDYFAAKAEVFPGDLQPALILALLGEPCWDSSYLGRIKWVAHGEAAYRYMKADAMIAERTASEEPK